MPNNTLQHPLTRWRLEQQPQMSAAELAARAGIRDTSLSRVERGLRDRLEADANLRLAQLTGIKFEELHGWRWTAAGRKAAKRVLQDAARTFRARAAARRRKSS